MTSFVIAHPFVAVFAAASLMIVVLTWLFIAGAAIASGRDCE
jgi:hypothetical protein